MCDTKWVLSNWKWHDMSEIEDRAVRKDDKYANENISDSQQQVFLWLWDASSFNCPVRN